MYSVCEVEMKIKVANYISRFLVEHGVTDCFMVTGGGAMHLDDALGHQEGLHCIFNHHEQASAIAAEAYARLTGNIAAVCVTSGPGGTNAITGVMGGWLDSIPMFIISGQVKRETTIWSCPELGLRQLGDQEFDIVDSVKNMTKYAVMVTDAKTVAYHLEKAWHLALTGRGGPVWLDVPLDIQGAMVETDEMLHYDVEAEDPWQIEQTTDRLAQTVIRRIERAKAPVLLVGTGIHLAGAERELLELVDKLKIPVVTAWNANDLVAYDSPYFAGMPGTVGTRAGNFVVQNADLLLSIGCRLNIRMIGYSHFDFAKHAYKIIIDIDKRELCKPTIQPDLPICADAKDFMQALSRQDFQPQAEHEEWLQWCRALLRKYPTVLPEYHQAMGQASLINPYVFIEQLFESLSPDDQIACGNGSACVITFQAAKVKQGQRMFTNSGCAAMGYGLPAAVGMAIANPEQKTICIDGDGSLMMNVQELATIHQNRLPIKLIILNNNGYLSIRQTQRSHFKPPMIGIDAESGVGFPDFAKLAEAFGLPYWEISQEQETKKVLERALGDAEPCVIEVKVDPEQNFAPKSSSRVLEDGSIVSPTLSDMAPFLPREEYLAVHYPIEK